jgi:hypothetical protein
MNGQKNLWERTAFITAGIALWLTGAIVFGAEKFVIPGGAAPYNGDSWANAYSNLQAAVDACIGETSTIYMRHGQYINDPSPGPGHSNSISIAGAVNLTIRGGYTGVDMERGATPTILTKPAAGKYRILYATNSTLTLDGLTVTNGTAQYGSGLYLANTTVVITNCNISSNKPGAASPAGIGIYAKGGSLTIANSRLTHNNSVYHVGGGAVYAETAAVTLRNSTLGWNYASGNALLRGGGLYLNGGSAFVDTCTFASNNTTSGTSMGSFEGGGIYALGAYSLVVTNSTFQDNYASSANGNRFGNSLFLAGTGTSTVQGCTFLSSRNAYCLQEAHVASTGPATFWNSTFKLGSSNAVTKGAASHLAMTNCLIYGYGLSGLIVTGGTVSVGSSTIANNGAWGVTNSIGTVTLVNSIVWDNLGGDLGNVGVSYSTLQMVHAGDGNTVGPPLFENAGAGDFSLSLRTSPSVNAGLDQAWMNDARDRAGFLRRQGGRVDHGAFESAWASTRGIIFVFQ